MLMMMHQTSPPQQMSKRQWHSPPPAKREMPRRPRCPKVSTAGHAPGWQALLWPCRTCDVSLTMRGRPDWLPLPC